MLQKFKRLRHSQEQEQKKISYSRTFPHPFHAYFACLGSGQSAHAGPLQNPHRALEKGSSASSEPFSPPEGGTAMREGMPDSRKQVCTAMHSLSSGFVRNAAQESAVDLKV